MMGRSGLICLTFFATRTADPIMGPVKTEMPRQSASWISRRMTFSKSGQVRLSTNLTSKPA